MISKVHSRSTSGACQLQPAGVRYTRCVSVLQQGYIRVYRCYSRGTSGCIEGYIRVYQVVQQGYISEYQHVQQGYIM